VLHLVFARADRVANETFVASIMRARVVLHLVEPVGAEYLVSPGRELFLGRRSRSTAPLPEIGCDVQRDVVFARARELRKRRELERGTAVPLRGPNRDAETPPLVFSSRLGLSLGYS
jgi:hypothetical protein